MENKNLIRSTEYSVKVKNIDLTQDDIADLSINMVYDFIEQGICSISNQEEDEEIHFQYQDIIREHLENLFKIK